MFARALAAFAALLFASALGLAGSLEDETAALGRDDYSAGDWPAVREQAAHAHNERTASYLLGMPLVGDFLEEGLSLLGYSCEEFEIERL